MKIPNKTIVSSNLTLIIDDFIGTNEHFLDIDEIQNKSTDNEYYVYMSAQESR